MARPKGGHNFNWKKHPDIEARLDEIYRGRYSQEVADILNGEFGTSFTAMQINNHLANHGKKSGIGKNRKGHRFFWTPEKEAFVAARCDKPYSVVIDEFEAEFGVRLTEGALGHFKWRHGLYSENDGRYRPGDLPANHSPLGAEVEKQKGYLWVKVSDRRWTGNDSKNNWKPKSHVVWEEANGPVPEGMRVAFRNGDTMDCRLENLMLVTPTELAYITQMGVKNMEPEARQTGELVARLMADIYTRRKNDGDDDGRAERGPVRDDREGQ